VLRRSSLAAILGTTPIGISEAKIKETADRSHDRTMNLLFGD